MAPPTGSSSLPATRTPEQLLQLVKQALIQGFLKGTFFWFSIHQHDDARAFPGLTKHLGDHAQVTPIMPDHLPAHLPGMIPANPLFLGAN